MATDIRILSFHIIHRSRDIICGNYDLFIKNTKTAMPQKYDTGSIMQQKIRTFPKGRPLKELHIKCVKHCLKSTTKWGN